MRDDGEESGGERPGEQFAHAWDDGDVEGRDRPGDAGTPWESLRHRAFRQAWHDHRALQLLRRLAGPDVAAKVARSVGGGVEGGVGSADTADPFTSGGTDVDAHLRWRHRVDDLIDAAGSSGDLVDDPPQRRG